MAHIRTRDLLLGPALISVSAVAWPMTAEGAVSWARAGSSRMHVSVTVGRGSDIVREQDSNGGLEVRVSNAAQVSVSLEGQTHHGGAVTRVAPGARGVAVITITY